MEKKINRSLCALGMAAALLCGLLVFVIMQMNAAAQMRQSVRESALLVADLLESGARADAFVSHAGTDLRVTVLSQDGDVLYDTAGASENHAGRPEVASAIQNGFGEASRASQTLQKQTYYYALRLSDSRVVRVSSVTDSVYARFTSIAPFLVLAVAVVSLAAAGASHLITRRLLVPIDSVDIEHPLQNETYDELTPFLRRIDRQNKQLSTQLDDMQAMRDELADIMENMTEGLVLLNRAGVILSINRSAGKCFDVQRSACVGKSLLALCRAEAFLALEEAARKGADTQQDVELQGRLYRASLSQTPRGGSLLLLVDITEKARAEQMRREFSANVSHELKTPLQSISGCAELLKDGVVKPEDQQRFYERIYTDSRRMIALVQDIIDLSRMDESTEPLRREPVQLMALAREAQALLAAKALAGQVSVEVENSEATVQGDARLLHELVFNLMDNAVSYNRAGGSVTVRAEATPDGVQLSVADTGVGIPPEHQSRVFERFYRVDKSHSRETGGTGLGLSIVKHAAALHGAHIALESAPNEGTTITVTFPKEAAQQE